MKLTLPNLASLPLFASLSFLQESFDLVKVPKILKKRCIQKFSFSFLKRQWSWHSQPCIIAFLSDICPHSLFFFVNQNINWRLFHNLEVDHTIWIQMRNLKTFQVSWIQVAPGCSFSCVAAFWSQHQVFKKLSRYYATNEGSIVLAGRVKLWKCIEGRFWWFYVGQNRCSIWVSSAVSLHFVQHLTCKSFEFDLHLFVVRKRFQNFCFGNHFDK